MQRITKTTPALLMLALAPGCAWWMGRRDVAPASEYIAGALDELANGAFARAEDILMRARARFPDDEVVLRWGVEFDRMQRRRSEALDLLSELTRAKDLATVSRQELMGQIGDLLFEMGKYGESSHYLRSGAVGPAEQQRRAKAVITLSLPYVRRRLEHQPMEAKLFAGSWPEMPCEFGDKSRICVLDTGSTMCTLARSLAKDVGVTDIREFGPVRDSFGHSHGAAIGVLPSLALCGVQIGPLPVLIVDDERMALRDPFGGPDTPPCGIIGLDVLSQFRFVLDMARLRVRLEPPRELTDRSVENCLLIEGCLVFPMKVDGVSMWFILDTAASHSSLTQTGLDALPGGARRATPDYRHQQSLAGRNFISRKVSGLVLQTSAVKFTGVEFPVVERLNAAHFPVHGVLGVDLLKHCQLTLDGGRIRLEQVVPAATTPQTGR